MNKIEVTTKSGFHAVISENLIDDWEFLETLNKANRGDISALFDAINYMLGEEQYLALKEHCRKADGTISTSRMRHEFEDIMSTDYLKK